MWYLSTGNCSKMIQIQQDFPSYPSLDIKMQIQYVIEQLMKRVYKVLLPLYREKEMNAEINQEWLQDSKGQEGLTFSLLAKLLFRIAHQWATHIDLDEYCELLHTIFQRITCVSLIQTGDDDSNLTQTTIYPQIVISFPLEEKKNDELDGELNNEANLDEWFECKSDESNRSDYEYKYEEDPEKMLVKKYKKPKLADAADALNTALKEAIQFKEVVKYQEFTQASQTYILNEIDNIFPLGFPSEQFFYKMKNDIYEIFQAQKDQRRMQGRSEENKGQKDVDSGMVKNKFEDVQTTVDLTEATQGVIRMKGGLYNYFRKIMKDAVNFSLRMHNLHPKPGYRTKARAGINSIEPVTEINKFGYNPALERRLHYKLMPIPSDPNHFEYLNLHYMLEDEDYDAAYRSDVHRVETKHKLSIREEQEQKKEEDFNNVETSYKKLRQIMLYKKFDSIYADRANSDNKEQKRLKKIIDKEEKRRAEARRNLPLIQKSLTETYEEKTFLKMMKGPYYQLQSKAGPSDDRFNIADQQDIIDDAIAYAYRIMIIGKPRSGKSTLAANLALKLDLVHISIDNWINALLAKVKAYEPPEDLEEGQEPPEWLTELEKLVNNSLQSGYNLSEMTQNDIIKLQMKSPLAQLKGYVLDLSYGAQRDYTWATTIRQQNFLGDPDDYSSIKEFSHIIEICLEDEEITYRTSCLRLNPSDGKVYSRWDREERKKPKIIPDGEDPPEEDEENIIKPLDEALLIQRPQDTDDNLKKELYIYNTQERSAVEELLINLYDNQYIKIESAGLTPQQLVDAAAVKIKIDDDKPLRPLPIVIEGCSDFKSILTEGLEENQIPRKWSVWKTVDPVSLLNGKLIQGLPEYAVHFSGNCFAFSSEENMKAFITEPKKYINSAPQMPRQFRINIIGPAGSGKNELTNNLYYSYYWKTLNFKNIVQNRLADIMNREVHVPNNPVGGCIGLSEQEKNEIIEGKPFPTWKFIPWLIDEMGYKLEKRKPPPPPPKEENEEEPPEEEEDEATKKKKEIEARKKRDEEEKKRKEEEEKEKAKEDRRRRRQEARDQGLDLAELGLEDSEEEPIIIEDLSIDQLVLGADENGVYPQINGFILQEFPETEEQINKLKEHGIEFDRVIYLYDTNEEDPGAELKQRMASIDGYDYDWENENAQRVLALAKEHLGGDDIVKEISCNGSTQDVNLRVQREINPFYTKVDNADDVRVSADLGEEDKKLPKSDYGDYCPVTYINDNWIVRGNPEQELTVLGKTYWLSGEKEAEEFKVNTATYVPNASYKTLPLVTPPPRIMILGNKGAGVSTQIRLLTEKYKLQEMLLRDAFLQKLKDQKEIRKRRRLLDRGFKPPQPADEDTGEVPPDPEIEDDPEDFEKDVHEREVMKMIYDNTTGYIIDGTWREIPEGAVNQSLQDLLFESRRVPEIVIILKCKEQSTFSRMIDTDSIKAEYDKMMDAREVERKRVREIERQEKLDALRADEEKTPEDVDAEMQQWEEQKDQDEEAAEENDPEKPVLDDMVEKFREALRETRTNDDTFFEDFSTVLKDKQVIVIDDIKADTSPEYIHIKILDRIKDNITKRIDLIEKQQTQPLKPTEVPFFEKSYVYRQSKFGLNSPVCESFPTKTKKFSVLYRERIFFLANQDQQDQFLKEPSRFTNSNTITPTPLDINLKPRVFVLGQPKSGKSSLCSKLSQRIGVVHLKMSKVIQSFMEGDSVESDLLRSVMLDEGRQLNDDLLVSLLIKRVNMKDCVQQGWVLEDFPKTRSQAIALAKRSILPTNVVYLKSDILTLYNKTEANKTIKFGANRNVLRSRIANFQFHIPYLISFFTKYYNNVTEIDANSSKWFVEDVTVQAIQNNLESRQKFTLSYYLKDSQSVPCIIRGLNMDRCLVKQSLSDFSFYCPVSWKNEKILVKCSANSEDVALFQDLFYFFRSTRERDLFIKNPQRFITSSSFPKPNDLPIRMQPHKAAEVVPHDKFLNSHCPVSLMDEERVIKGDPILLVIFKDLKFVFDSEFKLQRFLSNPFKYSRAALPFKMPPVLDKISLFNLQKQEDSIAFMEQALGQIVTRALREVGENRLKYPTISVKESMLKMFALFLKMENPANTETMKRKYQQKIRQFIQRCEISEELYDLAQEKGQIKDKGEWPQFKENYFNEKGSEYDKVIGIISHEKQENFTSYIR